MQPESKRLLPLVLLTLSLMTTLACNSGSPSNNAASSPTPASGLAASSAPAAGPTSMTTPVSPGGVNCGNCWVHIYDDKNFKETDDNLLLCGPGKWPNMRNLPSSLKPEWGNEIESLKVGPGATVTVWAGENYTGITQTYNPGQEIPNFLSTPLLKDRISSIEIKCQ